MQFMVGGAGIPIFGGARVIPPGAILNGLPPVWTATGITLTVPLPPDVIALDNAAANQMLQWWSGAPNWYPAPGQTSYYQVDLKHLLIWGPAVTVGH